MSLNHSDALLTIELAGIQESLPFPLGVNQTITTSGCCHHNTLSACRGGTPTPQSFTPGKWDFGHLYNHRLGCWTDYVEVPHMGCGFRTFSFHTLGAENPKAVDAQVKPGRGDTTASTA